MARRLAQVGVVRDVATGDSLRHDLKPGQRLVTAEGDLWRWDGFVQRAGAPSAAATMLRQRNRLTDLRGELERAEALLKESEVVTEQAKARAEDAVSRHAGLRDAVRRGEGILASARDRHAEETRKSAAAESRLAALAAQVEQLSADLAEARASLEEARQAQADASTASASRSQADARRAELAEIRGWLTEARSTLDRVVRDAGDRRRRIAQVGGEVDGWKRRREQASGQRTELRQRQEDVMVEIEALAERPMEIATQRLEVLRSMEEADLARTAAGDELAAAEKLQAEADKVMRDAEQAMAAAREERVRAEAAVEQYDVQVRQAAGAIAERLDATPAQAKEIAGLLQDDGAVPALDALENRLHRLLREREAMGPVNLRAEQETADLDEQMTTLVSERDDLVAAIARLRQGIGELNREGRQRLLASFEKVDTHFRRLFVRLFGGGRAHLALTESDDPLEAGLEIYASPPGKRLQVLSLLSGGEQAMTALALLFAVFLVNPAPICVLDEVDAPLDDANVDRFCTMLDELTRSAEQGTRFLVVTHHRMTMARMDRLFGVTMAERGVSKLVSVDLGEAVALREPA